jgi:(1->4)-alpha-D-glucan 1-alpha-D-glucosylmutase
MRKDGALNVCFPPTSLMKAAFMALFRIPVATYRLQLNRELPFADIHALVPYFQRLGISDLYTSPFLKARRHSPHGYDVTDHASLNPEIGTDEELAALLAELRRHDMGLILDVVPNHMDIDEETNRWWWDVLENGPSSPYARVFDIDWAPPKEDLANKVLLPILGDQYGKVLENDEIRLLFETGAFLIAYYERRFPVAPRSSVAILEPACERLRTQVGAEDPALVELESIITSLRLLPPRTETDPERIRVRLREKEVAKRRLATLVETCAAVREAIDRTVTAFNGQRGDPRSFDALEALLANQAYRLSYWRVATDEINYRRFFDVNHLAAIRVEEPDVFKAVHDIVFKLLGSGCVTGLRIDHPDGLFDPLQYVADLQSACGSVLPGSTPSAPSGALSCYVAVEKILVRDERLRTDWEVQGTTGYEFLNQLNVLFVDASAERQFHALYARVNGTPFQFGDIAYQSKKLILDGTMSSELHVLARRLDRISEQHRWSRDFTLFSLQEALAEVIACFPVYRTYIQAASNMVGDEDRHVMLTALRTAKRRNPAVSDSIFDFIGSVLLLQDPDGLGAAEQAERRDFVMRFQQITGPVMAKGIEDTAFYRAYPLASLNEVGGNPERFGMSIDAFHRQNAARLTNWPHTMLTTSTHDTKRSEDVRARIDVLSEMPREWERAVELWQALNHDKKSRLDDAEVPDGNEEYLLYQTLVGAWPLLPMDAAEHQQFVGRIERYMEKALKEAKLHTSWINPNDTYDQAVKQFVREILRPHNDNRFLADFRRFHRRVAEAGMWNSLAQVLLKMTVPGVPDFYQGTELWDFTLVDPDNRQPVDFRKRLVLLEELQRRDSKGLVSLVRELVASRDDGRLKLYVIAKTLAVRQRYRHLFQQGTYLPLAVSGAQQDHIIAFARQVDRQWLVVAVPRFFSKLSASTRAPLGKRLWKDARLQLPPDAPTVWHQVFTGEELSAPEPASELFFHALFRRLPLTLLTGVAATPSC